LAYHGARYYAPWLGRWISADPLGLTAGLNLFRYASNNPVGYIDSSGLQESAAPALLDSSDLTGLTYSYKNGDTAYVPNDPYAPTVLNFQDPVEITIPKKELSSTKPESVIPKPTPTTPTPTAPPEQSPPPTPEAKPPEAKPPEAKPPEASNDESTAEKIADVVTDFIPIVGGAKDIYQGIKQGNGWKVALGVGSIAFDIATLGGGSLLKGGIKAGLKQGAKALVKEGAELTAKQGVKILEEVSVSIVKKLVKAEKDVLRSEARDLIKATGRKIMPWQQVHHRIPLEFSHLFPGVNPNRFENLRVVNKYTHQIAHVWWSKFKSNYVIDAKGVIWAEERIAESMKWALMK
jgi:hypothetical protein